MPRRPSFSSFSSSSSPPPSPLEELEPDNDTEHYYPYNHDDPKSMLSFEQSQSQQAVDSGIAIAAELTRLSLKEREDILHDLHGVAPAVPETPELIQHALQQLHSYLEQQCPATAASPSVYRMALQSDNPSHVLDPAFGLLFLRSEHFVIPAAANKLLKFLQIKLELFGRAKLCHTITLDDLDDDDIFCLENGHFQLLPSRDRAGRAIFCFPAQIQNKMIPIQAELRHLYYVIMSALEDPETQINGVVMIPWGLPKQSPWHSWKANNIMTILPYQTKGWHAVLAESNSPWLSWLSSILDKKSRMRMRIHNGTHQEIMYTLMTFGIPTSHFPVQADGSVDRSHHHRWIQARRDLEARRRRLPPPLTTINGTRDESDAGVGHISHSTSSTDPMSDSSTSSEIFLPTTKDILFGRGKPYQQHAGNVRLSLMLESMQERYEALSRQDKTVMAQTIVKAFQEKGSRFLRRVSDDVDGILWRQVKDSEAREKVSQLFRSMRQGKHNNHHHGVGGGSAASGGIVGGETAFPPTHPKQAKKRALDASHVTRFP